jgi:hypothetical protein
MFTVFLLRGWPVGYDVWYEVTSFDTSTVVVAWATLTMPPARCRMTLIDPESDVVFIHHPVGRAVKQGCDFDGLPKSMYTKR